MENHMLRNHRNSDPRFYQSHMHRPKQGVSKIVSIPVQFIGSEKLRSESATKIQKLFRGYAVRKNLDKIAKIKSRVEEIRNKISEKETADLISTDAKERLRLNETLMSFLFELDSVRGTDPAVRECRKSVICKAIALQDAIDSIAETQLSSLSDPSPRNTEIVADPADRSVETGLISDQTLKVRCQDESQVSDASASEVHNSVESTVTCSDLSEVHHSGAAAGRIEPPHGDSLKLVREEGGYQREGSVEEGEDLRRLVSELCKQSAVQRRLIESLSRRVEQLERTLAKGKRIGKKRQNAKKIERPTQRNMRGMQINKGKGKKILPRQVEF